MIKYLYLEERGDIAIEMIKYIYLEERGDIAIEINLYLYLEERGDIAIEINLYLDGKMFRERRAEEEIQSHLHQV